MATKGTSTRTVTFRAPEKKVKALDRIAGQQQRDRSFVLNEAVDQYLALQQYHLEMIEEGLRQAKAEIGIPHEEIVAEFARKRAARSPTKKRAS
jgi:predicted transcriptional regulator